MIRRVRLDNPFPDLRRRTERAVASFRQVEPAQFVAAPSPSIDSSALIAIGANLSDAVRQVTRALVACTDEPVLVIPDNRTGSRPNPYATLALLEGLANRRALTSVALPSMTSRAWRQRWAHLAARAGVLSEPLGDEGWARVSFDGLPTMLESVDVPLELIQSGTVIALTSTATPDGCVALWRDIVHPNSAMRARVGGDASIAELSIAIQAMYLLTGQVGSLRIAALAQDRVVAELLALGIYRLREEPTGVEAVGPWEEPTVQHLVDVGAGAATASLLTLRIVSGEVGDNHPAALDRLAELLGCRIDGASA